MNYEICLLICLLIALGIGIMIGLNLDYKPKWLRNVLKKKEGEKLKNIVSGALRELNCDYSWKTEDNTHRAIFDYQSGHFYITLTDESPFIRLYFMSFFETGIMQMDTVRRLCNHTNIMTEAATVFYSVNDEQASIQVSMLTQLTLEPYTAKNILERAMTDIFMARNNFILRYHEQEAERKRFGIDMEVERAKWQSEWSMLHEQEIAIQESGANIRSDKKTGVSLQLFLYRTLGMEDFKPLELHVYRLPQQGGDVYAVGEDIKRYDLASSLIRNGRFEHEEAVISLSYNDLRMPRIKRRISILMQQETTTPEALYYRATLTRVPMSHQKISAKDSQEAQTDALSVLLAHDVMSDKQRLDEFKYRRMEAQSKNDRGEADHLTNEERLLQDALSVNLSYALFEGKRLFYQKRYLEALPPLENIFESQKAFFNTMQGVVKKEFFEVCYMIGFCHSALGQYKLANYYLEIVLPLQIPTYAEAYINALVGDRDFRALSIIENFRRQLLNFQIDDENAEIKTNVTRYLRFLDRHRAQLLIQAEKYDEAEQILQTLLDVDDLDSMNYAIKKLAYIRQRKEQKQE